jgi:signal transduction histidine kinase
MMSGKLHLRPARVNVNDVVRAAIDVVQTAAESKLIELTFQSTAPVAMANADSMRLQQIVWNLADAHGGNVRVESPGVGRGSTFTLTLPLVSTSETSMAAAPSANYAPGGCLLATGLVVGRWITRGP